MDPGKVVRELSLENGNHVVLLAYDHASAKNNLFAVNRADQILWEAEMIDRTPFCNVLLSEGKLLAMSFGGWLIELSPETGRIVSKEYVK
jgi:hypothetical protein